jgi:hypothetical protein
MRHSSYAPARRPIHEFDEDEGPPIRQRPALRLSRMPAAYAVVKMPIVAETFRKLGTVPPAAPDNDDLSDELSEDEIFAIWQARLL